MINPEIIKIGSFDEKGFPIDWHIGSGDHGDSPSCVIEFKAGGDILIGGVLMKEWSEDRKQKMNGPNLQK